MLHFGDFSFDTDSGELIRGDHSERLTPQAAHVLRLLVDRPYLVVTRAEFRHAIWPDTTVEFDQGLNYCIRQLRIALGDDAGAPRYIETLPRRGYRFRASVTGGSAAVVSPVALPISGHDASGRPRLTRSI